MITAISNMIVALRSCISDTSVPNFFHERDCGCGENLFHTRKAEDKRDFVIFAMMSVKNSVARRPKLG